VVHYRAGHQFPQQHRPEQLTSAYFMIRKRAEADTLKQMEAWA
jgi:hypothetical protein